MEIQDLQQKQAVSVSLPYDRNVFFCQCPSWFPRRQEMSDASWTSLVPHTFKGVEMVFFYPDDIVMVKTREAPPFSAEPWEVRLHLLCHAL